MKRVRHIHAASGEYVAVHRRGSRRKFHQRTEIMHNHRSYQDWKTSERCMAISMAVGILLGAMIGGWLLAILFGIAGLFIGAIIGWLTVIFN